jgi:DNA-binding response OmpR family regulator
MAKVMGPSVRHALECGSLEVYPAAYRAMLRGNQLPLTPAQVEVLTELVANRDRVVTRNELARAAGIDATSVDVVLSGLRRELGDGFVRNVRNRGWIIEPSVFGA